MSGQDRQDFDNRLAELNNWQIEQQKKLRAFQEAQRRLLDTEHQNVLSSLSTHHFGQWCDRFREGVSKNPSERQEPENSVDTQKFRNTEKNDIFQLKYQPIKLHEPKSSYFSTEGNSLEKDRGNNSCNELNEDFEEPASRPKKFLRRGEGLARFRMTLDDFKGPPKIYKEKKIKTYLNNKPEYGFKNHTNSKSVKSLKRSCNKGCKNVPQKPPCKSLAVPVKIYVPETKTKQCNSGRSLDVKPVKVQNNKKYNLNPPKVPIESLALKPCSIATEWYNIMKEKEKEKTDCENTEERINSVNDSGVVDVEKKKDEKELQIFEILEKKVQDSSFCSTSSFVDKLMEQSLSSTPSKPFINDKEFCKSYSKGLRSLRAQFLDEEQVKKFEGLDVVPLEEKETAEDDESERCKPDDDVSPASIPQDSPVEDPRESERENSPSPEPEVQEVSKEEPSQPRKVNKSLLQEYIKDFKNFKFLLAENIHRIEEPEEEPPPLELLKDDKPEEVINHHEIALKLRRKGLQDNVKHLLNWECPSRKKQTKRVVKKCKAKAKVEKSKAIDKDQGEKIIFNSSLLKMRLKELEDEIEIFRKENKNLEKLEKECNEERVKLSKERKEFEKQMQEEKEAFEVKMAEEHKKLQKEKMVFEKYCKQVKNQPTRQEREEMASLKKEIEKLTETLATKEARWGASQARLRNQVKNLEKENSQLKAEIEKYKKLSMKKVSFENDKMLNTKIIHVINSELGKLKPTVIKNGNGVSQGKNQCLSARTEKDQAVRPLRRIKSNPNMKKPVEVDLCTEVSNDYDDKVLGSASTDSGIETNGSRYVPLPKTDTPREYKISREAPPERPQLESKLGRMSDRLSSESIIESAVSEAVFGSGDVESTNWKIHDVKSRLERLNLLKDLEGEEEYHSPKMVRLPNEPSTQHRHSESEEGSESSEEEEEEEGEEKGLGVMDFCGRKNGHTTSPQSFLNLYSVKNSVTERKLDENGVWEKSFEDGSKEISYPNGNVKKIFPGNKIVKMVYYNGDIKETNVSEGSEKYYYAETKTWHTTYKDGLEVLEFPNGQTERRHADGSTEISFPNGCVRYCDSSGRDEWRFLDGTVIKTNECGHKILLMPNGQKEIHTKEFKRREYPDGTVKILYADGTQETRYATGRVRLKDKDGNLVMDSGGIR